MAKSKKKPEPPFVGRWHIESMEQWDEDFINAEVRYEGYSVRWAWMSCAPLRRFKASAHEGGVSTPGLIAWPAGLPRQRQGQTVLEPAHLIDVLPTCLELAGGNPAERPPDSPAVEGVSLLLVLRGERLQRPAPLFWEHEGSRAVRQGKWKLVADFEKAWQLFDLEVDRGEQHDLVAAEPERVHALTTLYEGWARRCGAETWAKALGRTEKKIEAR